jgi:hypothetical protein
VTGHAARYGGVLLLLLLPAACEEAHSGAGPPPRSVRGGVLLDFVLIERSEEEGGPYFLDRFETTRADWQAWHRAEGNVVSDPADGAYGDELPVTGITFEAARKYAAWHGCRLQRYDEWWSAATVNGFYLYPWGNRSERTWANGVEFGLGTLTRVGTFESGRSADGAYDLIGNAAEWTESIPPWFFVAFGDRYPGRVESSEVVFNASSGISALERCLGDLRWARGPLCWPGGWIVAAIDPQVPRSVVGGHCATFVFEDSGVPVLEMRPREWSSRVGFRLAGDPGGLLGAWFALATPGTELRTAVLSFCSRPAHRRVLREAFVRAEAAAPYQGPLHGLLRRHFGL